MQDQLLTTAEVCEIFRCSERSVNRMVADGILNPLRLRGLVRFRQSELDELIEALDLNPDECQCDGQCECVKE